MGYKFRPGDIVEFGYTTTFGVVLRYEMGDGWKSGYHVFWIFSESKWISNGTTKHYRTDDLYPYRRNYWNSIRKSIELEEQNGKA